MRSGFSIACERLGGEFVSRRMSLSTFGARLIDRREETVAVSGNRLDVPRTIGGIPQRRPQLGHSLVQAAVEIHESVSRPKLFAQLFTGHHFSRVFQQEGENLERLFLQLDTNAVLAQFGGARVYLKDPKPLCSKGPLRRSHDHSPLQLAEPSMQRQPNQYGLRPSNVPDRPNLRAFAILDPAANPRSFAMLCARYLPV